MSEDKLQQLCYLWFHNKFPNLRGLLFHVPNGGSRNAREGAKFKAMGVWPGVADILFFYDYAFYCIELKVGKGRQSERQKKWEELIKKEGAEYVVVRTLTEFQDVINKIVKPIV